MNACLRMRQRYVEIWIVAEIDSRPPGSNMCPFVSFNFISSFFFLVALISIPVLKKIHIKWTDIMIAAQKKTSNHIVDIFNVQANWLRICNNRVCIWYIHKTKAKKSIKKTQYKNSEKQIINDERTWSMVIFANIINSTNKWLFRELIAFNHLL